MNDLKIGQIVKVEYNGDLVGRGIILDIDDYYVIMFTGGAISSYYNYHYNIGRTRVDSDTRKFLEKELEQYRARVITGPMLKRIVFEDCKPARPQLSFMVFNEDNEEKWLSFSDADVERFKGCLPDSMDYDTQRIRHLMRVFSTETNYTKEVLSYCQCREYMCNHIKLEPKLLDKNQLEYFKKLVNFGY